MGVSRHSVGSFSPVQRWLRFAFFLGIVAWLFLGRFGSPVQLAGALGCLALSLLSTASSRLIVGADGLLLQWLFFRKFVPYSVMSHVSLQPVLTTDKQGRPQLGEISLQIDRIGQPSILVDPGPNARETFDAIVGARRRHARAETAFDPSILSAAHSDEATWFERLRALAARVDNFRVDAPDTEELLAVLDDATVGEEARAGAAVVLASKRDEAIESRLRVALESTASPKLRIAIEAAIAGEDESIVRALEGVREA